MEKFNNHGLDAINSRVCMRADEYDDEGQIKHVKSKQVYNRDYTNEYLGYSRYIKTYITSEGLQKMKKKRQSFF